MTFIPPKLSNISFEQAVDEIVKEKDIGLKINTLYIPVDGKMIDNKDIKPNEFIKFCVSVVPYFDYLKRKDVDTEVKRNNIFNSIVSLLSRIVLYKDSAKLLK